MNSLISLFCGMLPISMTNKLPEQSIWWYVAGIYDLWITSTIFLVVCCLYLWLMNSLNSLFGGMLPVSMNNELPQHSIWWYIAYIYGHLWLMNYPNNLFGGMLPVSMNNELPQQSIWWYVAYIYGHLWLMNYPNNLFGGMLSASMTNAFPQQSIWW